MGMTSLQSSKSVDYLSILSGIRSGSQRYEALCRARVRVLQGCQIRSGVLEAFVDRKQTHTVDVVVLEHAERNIRQEQPKGTCIR